MGHVHTQVLVVGRRDWGTQGATRELNGLGGQLSTGVPPNCRVGGWTADGERQQKNQGPALSACSICAIVCVCVRTEQQIIRKMACWQNVGSPYIKVLMRVLGEPLKATSSRGEHSSRWPSLGAAGELSSS